MARDAEWVLRIAAYSQIFRDTPLGDNCESDYASYALNETYCLGQRYLTVEYEKR